jgi:hypothetical protein
VTAMSSSDSPGDDGSLSEFDVSKEETLLRINFSFDDDEGSSALAAVESYTKSFPFAAVLPVQPLTYLPGENRASVADGRTDIIVRQQRTACMRSI